MRPGRPLSLPLLPMFLLFGGAGAADLWFVIDPAKMQVSVQKDGVAQP